MDETVSKTIEEQIEATAAAGKAALAESERRQQEAKALEEAHEEALRIDAWRPALDAIRAVLPAWAHKYLQEPVHDEPEEYSSYYARRRIYPVTLLMPSCAPIYVYTKERNGTWVVDFATVHDIRVVPYEFGDAPYRVTHEGGRSWEIGEVSWHPDRFAAVVHMARELWPEMQAAQAEAERKNAEHVARQAQPETEPTVQRSTIEVALAQFEHFYNVDEDRGDSHFNKAAIATIAYAAVAQAEELHRIADLLDQSGAI